MKNIFMFILLCLLVISCSYNKKVQPVNCNTTNVSFSADVYTTITSQCLGCHNNSFLSGGINLQGFNNVKNIAQTGLLVNVIEHNAGFSPMPKGSAKIDNCSIEKIKQWVTIGMPNN